MNHFRTPGIRVSRHVFVRGESGTPGSRRAYPTGARTQPSYRPLAGHLQCTWTSSPACWGGSDGTAGLIARPAALIQKRNRHGGGNGPEPGIRARTAAVPPASPIFMELACVADWLAVCPLAVSVGTPKIVRRLSDLTISSTAARRTIEAKTTHRLGAR